MTSRRFFFSHLDAVSEAHLHEKLNGKSSASCLPFSCENADPKLLCNKLEINGWNAFVTDYFILFFAVKFNSKSVGILIWFQQQMLSITQHTVFPLLEAALE